MKTNLLKSLMMTSAIAIGMVASFPAAAQTPDRDPNLKTADDQKNNKADNTLTAEIRKQILDNKSLSTAAHNVKVVSENGTVTLRGDVNSDTEKKQLLDIARKVAGPANVTDQMTVKPPNP